MRVFIHLPIDDSLNAVSLCESVALTERGTLTIDFTNVKPERVGNLVLQCVRNGASLAFVEPLAFSGALFKRVGHWLEKFGRLANVKPRGITSE